jgi:hypothetical protein
MLRDSYLDNCRWATCSIVAKARHWLRGKEVLIHPELMKRVSWDKSTVFADLSKESIKNSPIIDSSKPLRRDDQTRMPDHYNRPKYWVG